MSNSPQATRFEDGTRRKRPLVRVGHGVFALLLAAVLLTPAWRMGIFTWFPVIHVGMLGGRPASLGVFSLLPVVLVLCWASWRLLDRGTGPWRWGWPGQALPLAGLSVLVLASLDLAWTWRTLVQVGAVAGCWLVLLFVVNERPGVILPLAVVVAVQSAVAIGQFVSQRDLGLGVLGEPGLDPAIEGASVLVANGRPWLRAYGLTGHPNALGALLAILLLILLPSVLTATGWRRWGGMAVVLLGLAGLLLSFSRNAWLAFGGGLLVLAVTAQATWRAEAPGRRKLATIVAVGLAGLVLLAIVGVTREQIASRLFRLDIPVEAVSLRERRRDAAIAVDLIVRNLGRGVGAANYRGAASALDPEAGTVHNVPLLATAELGLAGLAFLVWLGLAPFVMREPARAGVPWYRRTRVRVVSATAPWVALLLLGLFDVSLWLSSSWQAAVLVGLLVGLQSRAREGLA